MYLLRFNGLSDMRLVLLVLFIILVGRPVFSQDTKFDCKMETFIDIDKWGAKNQKIEEFSFWRNSRKVLPKIVFENENGWFALDEFYTIGNHENFETVFSGATHIAMNRGYFNYSYTSSVAIQAIVAKCIQR